MKEDALLLKEKFRRELRSENQRHEAEQALASEQITRRLKEQLLWKNARAVLFFFPLPGEPDLRGLCREAIADGKTVAFPRHIKSNDAYAALQINDLGRDLAPGRFGIPEPCLSCAELPLNVLDLILVPGLGFTFGGARLGRGKGYYDRLLARALGVRCGVAFDWQIVAELPSEPHDILVDCLVTPSHWRWLRTVD